MAEDIVFVEISELDFKLIMYVRKLRTEGKIRYTQQELSKEMGLSKSFVGNVESFLQLKKYNIRHLALLAKAFRYKSVSKLFDFPTPKYDMIRLTLKITTVVKENGKTRNKSVEVIKVEPVETI